MHGASLLRIVGFLGFAVFLLITFTRLPYFLAGLTRMPPRLEPADAIVVLAATINATGVLSQASFRRAIHGIALQRRGLAPLLVFSGGTGAGTKAEADVRAALARDLGVPAERVLTDTGARTTREEAIRLPTLLRRMGARKILLVSDPQHMARAVQLFTNAGLEVLPAPADEPEQSIVVTRELVQELFARLYYRIAGYL